jgi:hypothetical protein
MKELAKRTVRSARRKPLLALLCVLAVVGGGTGGAVALAASPPSVPPAPVLTVYPPDPNNTATSTFAWSDSQAGVTYLCSVENGKFAATVTPPGGGAAQPCSSPLTYSVATVNNGEHQFAVEAIDSLGNVSSITKYMWKVPKTALPITIGGNAGAVYPGGTPSSFQTTITNPNSLSVTITSLTVSLGAMPSGCQASWFTLAQSNVSPGNPLTVPGGSSVTLPQGTVSAPSVAMADSGDQSSCQGQTIPVTYDGGFSGNFSVGAPTPFAVSVGPLTGGALFPTSLTDPHKVVDTVQVTVTNNGQGAQFVHHITYEVTPGWTATLAGHPDCNAYDFSIDGLPVNTADTVSVNTDIPPGGHITGSFTVQLVENNANQDACQNAQVGLTALVN